MLRVPGTGPGTGLVQVADITLSGGRGPEPVFDARIDRLRSPARQLLVDERPEWAVWVARAVVERSDQRDRFRQDSIAARDLLRRVT